MIFIPYFPKCIPTTVEDRRKEITKSPVIYFYDLGLRNYALGLFGNLFATSEVGFVFQNFVLNLLKETLRFSSAEIHFWRTKDKAEVDIIIDLGKKFVPKEVKFRKLKKPEIGRALRNFIMTYQPEYAWIINLSFKAKIKWNNTEVQILPFYELIRKDLVANLTTYY